MTEVMITGYQYGPDNRFIGKFIFPKNLDKDAVHLPYNTVLIAPPIANKEKDNLWDGVKWVNDPLPEEPKPQETPHEVPVIGDWIQHPDLKNIPLITGVPA